MRLVLASIDRVSRPDVNVRGRTQCGEERIVSGGKAPAARRLDLGRGDVDDFGLVAGARLESSWLEG